MEGRAVDQGAASIGNAIGLSNIVPSLRHCAAVRPSVVWAPETPSSNSTPLTACGNHWSAMADASEGYPVIGPGCVGCGWCSFACPVPDCIKIETGLAVIDRELCARCNRCAFVCPVDAITSIPTTHGRQDAANSRAGEAYDGVVIGAGMGGMLAACRLSQQGRHVLLVEKLSFLGGRFAAFDVSGGLIVQEKKTSVLAVSR